MVVRRGSDRDVLVGDLTVEPLADRVLHGVQGDQTAQGSEAAEQGGVRARRAEVLAANLRLASDAYDVARAWETDHA